MGNSGGTTPSLVRPYAPADRAALVDLLRQVWPNKRPLEPHVDTRWWWQLPSPPIYVVEDRDAGGLAGLCAYLPFHLHTRGHAQSAAWFVDFYVLPGHQGRGFGKQLTQAVQERFDVTASLSQTAMAWRVFEKLGWRPRAEVQLSMHPWPKTWMFREQSGCEIVRVPIDAQLPVRAELDALWARVAPAFPAIAARTSDDILRRYASHGDRAYELLVARRGTECAGYAVVRRALRSEKGHEGLIVDVLAAPQDTDTFGALLSASSRRLLELGAERIYCLVTPEAWRGVLARHGFLSAATPLLGGRLRSQTKYLTWTARDAASVPDPAEWFVTLGDCDLDLVWQRTA